MAKRKPVRRAKPTKSAKKRPAPSRSAKRPIAKRASKPKASAKKKAPARTNLAKGRKAAISAKPKSPGRKAVKAENSAVVARKVPRLDRPRRTLADTEPHSTPSSLDLDRHSSSARSGRAAMQQSERDHHGMSSDITGGDVDVDVEDAYFTGDGTPGGDNPSPDLEVVDDIGKALGVTYDDNEELQGDGKVAERDKHRWELDPASAEDYRDRDKK